MADDSDNLDIASIDTDLLQSDIVLSKGNKGINPQAKRIQRQRGNTSILGLIRELTLDGKILVQHLVDVVTGEKKDSEGKPVKINPREQNEAVRMLLDRGYGKVPETNVNVNLEQSEAQEAFKDLSSDELRQGIATLKKTLSGG